MRILGEERTWSLVAVASAALAGVIMRNAVQGGWRLARGEDPPDNPAAPSVDWKEALLWSIAVGATVGMARMLGERSAAAGWRKLRGGYPKNLS